MQYVDKMHNSFKAKAEISYAASTVDSLRRQPIDDIEMKAVKKKDWR
jgi:hypothetical protein